MLVLFFFSLQFCAREKLISELKVRFKSILTIWIYFAFTVVAFFFLHETNWNLQVN